MTTVQPTHYGRSEGDWDRLTDEGLVFLIERARLCKVTSYTEMNTTLARRTGLRGFDFERADERAAMGHLLGLIVERNLPDTNLMVSALVHYLDQNDAGPGFYALAQQDGFLPAKASPSVKWEFWVTQVKALHDFYAQG